MNIDLLQRVKTAILAEPESFDMKNWFEDQEKSPCGTAACIAGHAITIARNCKSVAVGRVVSWKEPVCEMTQAGRHLDLSTQLQFKLFCLDEWPSEFANRYRRNKTARGRAKVAAERIDYFIETGK